MDVGKRRVDMQLARLGDGGQGSQVTILAIVWQRGMVRRE